MTVDIINKLDSMSSNIIKSEEFEKRKCITYIDEFEFALVKGELITKHIVSFTAIKNEYIESLEKDWIDIRNRYGFEKSEPIHFTSLREVSKIQSYFDESGNEIICNGWNQDYIENIYEGKIKALEEKKNKEYRKFIENYLTWKKFRKLSNNKYILDTNRLKEFYESIINCIKKSKIVILCTSYLENQNNLYKKGKISTIDKSALKSPYYVAFLEHLNLITFYLRHGYLTNEQRKAKRSLYNKNFITKLRCDGDDGFNSKNDYRLAFNKAVTAGTKEFYGQSVLSVIDEIRFINKTKIGGDIAHAGCDIIDFLASYVGMNSIKEDFIGVEIKREKTKEQAEEDFNERTTFEINGVKFDPFEECIKEKILNENGYLGIQKIKDSNFSTF